MTAISIAIFPDRDRAEFLRWGIASALVLAAHSGLIATYLLLHRPDRPPAGAPIVLVDLAPAPSAPDVAPLDLPPEPGMAQAQPEPPVIEPPPEEPPPPVPEVTTSIRPPPPPPKPHVEPQRKKPPAPRTTARATAPVQSAAPAAARYGLASVESSAAQASWRDLLVAHLQRHKRYPSGAQSRHEQGTAVLSFTMDRGGRVLAHRIVSSSGNAELDSEVTAMIQRAQPLPAFPPSMAQAQITLSVPIRFSVR